MALANGSRPSQVTSYLVGPTFKGGFTKLEVTRHEPYNQKYLFYRHSCEESMESNAKGIHLEKIRRYREKDYHDNTHTEEEREFFEAVEQGNTGVVQELVQEYGINVNITRLYHRLPTTALQLSAQKNDFAMVRLLAGLGANSLNTPSVEATSGDIQTEQHRIGVFTALSSSCIFIVLSRGSCNGCEDYSKLEIQVEDFLIAMLNSCYMSEECKVLLHGNMCDKPRSMHHRTWKLAQLAVNNKQKRFVAAAKFQHTIRQEWVKGQPSWSLREGWSWTLVYAVYAVILYGVLQPIVSLVYILFPCSSICAFIEGPKSKFFMHLFSYMAFLILFVLATLLPVLSMLNHQGNHPLLEIIRILEIIWIIGILYGKLQKAYIAGFKVYFTNFWNLVMFLTLLIFGIDSLVLSCLSLSFADYLLTHSIPAFLAAIPFLHIINYLYVSSVLGPLLLAFMSIKGHVIRFLCLFTIVVLAFAVSLFCIYAGNEGGVANDGYTSLTSSIKELVYSLFGEFNDNELLFTGLVHIVNGSLTANEISSVEQMHSDMGALVYAAFGILCNLVLVNLCIAMMADTYNRIQENINVIWKFERTRIWMNYVNAPAMAPPFNILPSTKCIQYMMNKKRKSHHSPVKVINSGIQTVSEDNSYTEIRYSELVPILVDRYLEVHYPSFCSIATKQNSCWDVNRTIEAEMTNL
ncbi:short transient receptor potential channel 4-like [Saccoglossus kowalevskii]|uniref:Short transient receptor potential channel 4-like n=1 Tax=Saccoglossus kowalevskii TaxID=10224 RepID=A0ABM0M4S9_SACKO|nr:PREDICTED: short transient receptor potential channel 4-like [Saccoglossus kowalevskii]